jgi:hypothetical protein
MGNMPTSLNTEAEKSSSHRLWCRRRGVPLSDELNVARRRDQVLGLGRRRDAAAKKKAGKKKRSLQKAEEEAMLRMKVVTMKKIPMNRLRQRLKMKIALVMATMMTLSPLKRVLQRQNPRQGGRKNRMSCMRDAFV